MGLFREATQFLFRIKVVQRFQMSVSPLDQHLVRVLDRLFDNRSWPYRNYAMNCNGSPLDLTAHVSSETKM